MVELLAVEDAQVAFSTKLLMIMRITFSGSVQMQAYVIEKRVFVTATRDFPGSSCSDMTCIVNSQNGLLCSGHGRCLKTQTWLLY